MPNWKTLSRIEEDGRKWLGRPKLRTKSCRAVLKRIVRFYFCEIKTNLQHERTKERIILKNLIASLNIA